MMGGFMPNPMAALGLAQGGAAAMARLGNPMAAAASMQGKVGGGFLPAMGIPRMGASMLAQNRMMPMMPGKPMMPSKPKMLA